MDIPPRCLNSPLRISIDHSYNLELISITILTMQSHIKATKSNLGTMTTETNYSTIIIHPRKCNNKMCTKTSLWATDQTNPILATMRTWMMCMTPVSQLNPYSTRGGLRKQLIHLRRNLIKSTGKITDSSTEHSVEVVIEKSVKDGKPKMVIHYWNDNVLGS